MILLIFLVLSHMNGMIRCDLTKSPSKLRQLIDQNDSLSTPNIKHLSSKWRDFCTPPHKQWRGIMLYPTKILKFWVSVRPSVRLSVRPSVCPSVRPPVSASFPESNLSSFSPIFFKLCMDINIREEWFGIANGLNSFMNNRVMALD